MLLNICLKHLYKPKYIFKTLLNPLKFQIIFILKWIQVCSYEGPALFQGEIITKKRKYMDEIKTLLWRYAKCIFKYILYITQMINPGFNWYAEICKPADPFICIYMLVLVFVCVQISMCIKWNYLLEIFYFNQEIIFRRWHHKQSAEAIPKQYL